MEFSLRFNFWNRPMVGEKIFNLTKRCGLSVDKPIDLGFTCEKNNFTPTPHQRVQIGNGAKLRGKTHRALQTYWLRVV